MRKADMIKSVKELMCMAREEIRAYYVYDPDHKKKPSGAGWTETEKG